MRPSPREPPPPSLPGDHREPAVTLGLSTALLKPRSVVTGATEFMLEQQSSVV